MADEQKKPICGIVMPISAIDGCNEAHWADVHEIIVDAIEEAGFDGNLVSNADDVGIIQKRIIQNLYENPVVVCDVSGKNPNVMFELGMRLAFDKPTIIVKDDCTQYSFDTSPIEHLEYPRDLRFSKIVDFKQRLADKIKKTHEKARDDNNYTTFLKHFGEFKVPKIDSKEVPGQEYMLDELRNIRMAIRRLETNAGGNTTLNSLNDESKTTRIAISLVDASEEVAKKVMSKVTSMPGIKSGALIRPGPKGTFDLRFNTEVDVAGEDVLEAINRMLPSESSAFLTGVSLLRSRKRSTTDQKHSLGLEL